MWGQELGTSLRHCHVVLRNSSNDDSGHEKKVYLLGVRLKRALVDVWKDAPNDVFHTPYVFICHAYLVNDLINYRSYDQYPGRSFSCGPISRGDWNPPKPEEL